jgi:hypothetical protein
MAFLECGCCVQRVHHWPWGCVSPGAAIGHGRRTSTMIWMFACKNIRVLPELCGERVVAINQRVYIYLHFKAIQ